MRFRLKRGPKMVCWALTGRSFGFSTAPLVKALLEGAQPAQIVILGLYLGYIVVILGLS